MEPVDTYRRDYIIIFVKLKERCEGAEPSSSRFGSYSGPLRNIICEMSHVIGHIRNVDFDGLPQESQTLIKQTL